MGADQISRCPRCVKNGEALFIGLQKKVEESYGKVPIQEFFDKKASLDIERKLIDSENSFRTFREDFDVSGVDEGTVVFNYQGSCHKCRLEVKFTVEHDIPGLSDV